MLNRGISLSLTAEVGSINNWDNQSKIVNILKSLSFCEKKRNLLLKKL